VKEADSRSSKYIQRFYDEQREVNQVYAAYSQARELGDLPVSWPATTSCACARCSRLRTANCAT